MKHDPLLAMILAALAVSCGEADEPEPEDDTGCMAVDATLTQCPHSDDLKIEDLFLHFNCDEEIVSKRGPGTLTELTGQDGVTFPACCYAVSKIDPDPRAECVVGRPFTEAGQRCLAAIELDGDARAKAWAKAAEGEHSSVAAFARLSLQLMALGAPLDLLEQAHQAALDEVRHTRACVEMAKRCGAQNVEIGAFPFGPSVAVSASLVELAVDAVREGCVNETLGAYAAREAAIRSIDPAARAVLQEVADDEARHAALAYRIVAWALAVGGRDVRAAVIAALGEPAPQLDTAELALRAGLDAQELNSVVASGARRVVQPALEALLAA